MCYQKKCLGFFWDANKNIAGKDALVQAFLSTWSEGGPQFPSGDYLKHNVPADHIECSWLKLQWTFWLLIREMQSKFVWAWMASGCWFCLKFSRLCVCSKYWIAPSMILSCSWPSFKKQQKHSGNWTKGRRERRTRRKGQQVSTVKLLAVGANIRPFRGCIILDSGDFLFQKGKREHP